ncbi:MAG: hypothetical protein Kow00111_22710 [Thermincola ferriacetica]
MFWIVVAGYCEMMLKKEIFQGRMEREYEETKMQSMWEITPDTGNCAGKVGLFRLQAKNT